MTSRDPQFDAYVLKIHAVLDRLDYYRLFGLTATCSAGEVRKAFYAVADKFHPDRNRDADPQVSKALYDIFKRLNEAYRVLCDPRRRKMYDEVLAEGKVRLDQDMRKASGPKNPEDTIRNRDARQFYRKAVEEFKKGNLMQADLHIKMAKSRDPKAKVILELEAQVKGAKSAPKKS